jgi:hypothetical protein
MFDQTSKRGCCVGLPRAKPRRPSGSDLMVPSCGNTAIANVKDVDGAFILVERSPIKQRKGEKLTNLYTAKTRAMK